LIIYGGSIKKYAQTSQNTAFGNKVRKLKPGHGSFWNLTKIIKNKFRAIPVLKMDGLTLITVSEKVNAIASEFSLSHENSRLLERSRTLLRS
jgi:hypothetical protein